MIFDEKTLQKLNQLNLVSSKVRAGIMKGERRSTKRGSSIEFADYRDYVSGDDLRRLDWNVYARLDRPFIKLLEEEEDLSVHILVDMSTSMNWGDGDQNKCTYALRLAGAIGTIALNSGDRLFISALYGDNPGRHLGPIRSAQQLFRLYSFLEDLGDLRFDGQIKTNLNENLKEHAMQTKRPGLVFIFSDFFSPDGYESGLNQLLGRGYEVIAVHILNLEELNPPFAGDLRLVDCETGLTQEVSIDRSLRDSYSQRLENWQNSIRQHFQKRGARYISTSTSLAWDKLLFTNLRQSGVVK